MELTRSADRRRGAGSAAGMSLIEVVIASFILLVIALGVLPLFTRSMASNASGADSTYVANMATERAEELMQLDYAAEPLRIGLGDQERVYNEVYVAATDTKPEGWIDGTEATATTAGRTPQWTRVTTIRQYNVNDLSTPVPGEDPLNPNPSAQIKEIEVRVAGLRSAGPLGNSRDLAVRVLKSP